MQELIKGQFADHITAMQAVAELLSPIVADTVETICTAMTAGRKILVMGNGGSAADAQHFAAEFIGRFKLERPSLPAIALTTDSSILTAIGNDYGYDAVFSRQVEGLAAAGDIVIGISTSGNSPNVLAALKLAREKGCITVSLLGRDGGSIKAVSDIPIIVPSNDTPRIQEAHILIIHIICDLVERRLFTH
ncbi:MAG: D-sedoheptulose 7-phosphate isomerase [Geobacter sp.]|nr:D-sedoheptulose 7-phosphate isomerase [Geobacter sp.]